jgi:prolyl oligopeptidase
MNINIKLLPYPSVKKDAIVDDYFGTQVPDPYRWLEDDEAEDTKQWVIEQNKVTQNYLSQIPYRGGIYKRLEALWNYEKYSAPFKEGAYTYFYKNDGLQSQSVLYRQQQESGEAMVFLDPNTFSADGTTSLSGIDFSRDGSMAAYQLSAGGSDWKDVVVIDTNSLRVIDTLKDVKFSGIAWKGNEGFYYSTYNKPEAGSQLSGLTQFHTLYHHQLGTTQQNDSFVFGGTETPRRYISGYLTEDERYLVITAAESTTGNELYLQDLDQPGGGIINIVDGFESQSQIIDNEGSKLYIFTNLNAPNYKVVTANAVNAKPLNWTDLIPQTENVLSVSTGAGKLFAEYLKDAASLVMQYSMLGQLEHQINLPGVGTASGFSTKKTETDTYYSFTSYTYPTTIFKLNIETGRSEIYRKSGVSFDPDLYESRQIFYKSKDGTRIPMVITYKKGLVMDGQNPTLLYAYGGFGVSLTPSFSLSNIVLLEQGGIYAVPNIRGGGEYGDDWHIAGTKLQKQNVFDDFIAAAEYLIDNLYTSPGRLAIAGGSNGGLLVGAILTQRADLFKVALPAVGVLDMLRYNQFTAGAGWAYDYGTARDSEEMFLYLHKYSPYHALKPGNYPATLVMTADHDDRVVPAHSFKFASRLQEYQQGGAPVLIRVETNAGHGAGKSTAQVIQEATDKWSFMFANMNLEVNI